MKKGKLALMIISGIIGISVIGNMLGSTGEKANNNSNSKNPENENTKIEQKAEKTEEQLKSEEEQKKKEEEQKNEEKKKLEQKELEEKNKRARDAAIGAAATAAVVTSRNNGEAKLQKAAEEARPATSRPRPVTRSAQTAEPQVDSNVRGVYITPNGKRYHYDPQCGGKNSYRVGINSVGGRTPCKKCVH